MLTLRRQDVITSSPQLFRDEDWLEAPPSRSVLGRKACELGAVMMCVRIGAAYGDGDGVASGVADKDFSWIHATDEKIHRPIIAHLLSITEADPSPAPHHYDWNYGASVTIVTVRVTSSHFTVPPRASPRNVS